MLDLSFFNTTHDKTYAELYFEKILIRAVEVLNLKHLNLELSINIVGEQKIKTLNSSYRHKDMPTDVLSFPLIESDIPIGPTHSNAILDLGDIFISLPVAKRKAVQLHKTLDEELQFLTVHGFLHLLGYDHERSPTEESTMFSLQDSILLKLSKNL